MENSVFESKSIPKAYLSLAVPVVLSMVISIVYNITDTYFIALTNNTDLVAGISLCAPVFTLLMGFGNIFGQGGSSLISRLLGDKDNEQAKRVSSFCFYAAILFGIAAGAVMVVFRNPVLRLLGADEDTLRYAARYFVIYAAGAPLVTLSFIHSNLLRAEGRAKESMIASIGGTVVNIVFDPVFIFGLKLGAAGAAIATLLGYLFTDIFCLVIVLKKSDVLSVDVRKYKIPADFTRQIFGIGISAALSNITQSICIILMNQSLLVYGNEKIAAMGIAQKVSMIVMLIIVGLAFGGAPLIGYTYGSKNEERMKKLLSFAIRFLCLTALVLSAVLIIAAPLAIRLFIEDPELAETGAFMLRTQLIGTVFMAIVLFGTIFFQATGKTLPSMLLALSRQGVVYVIVLFAASRIAGYNGILLTQFFADVISAVLAVFLFVRARRNRIKEI